ncbi:MAG: hypothetical protein J6C51_00290 [Clostridia bacterium]|nr:hypothetical protein [Clostridia bacterium]
MLFTPYMEIYPDYDDNCDGTRSIATNSYLKDGNILYLMGGTVLCKYDISNKHQPKLLKKVDIAADHTGDPETNYIRKGCAHSTSIVDIGKYLVVSLRDSSGGITNMAEGVIVGNISIISKETLEKVKELNFENKVTYISRYKDLLIVSMHFHGFYFYKISNTADILCCILKYIEIEKPRSTSTREFQNSTVFEVDGKKINIAMASYKNGISVYTYDLEDNCVSTCCELNPEVFPDMYDVETGVRNTVFGLTAKGNFVYGGITPGNNRFREQYKNVDWKRFDKRGIIYGSHNRLSEEYYHMELSDEDKPKYIGVIAGDPSPSFLCTAGSYLLFNLDKQGLGIARIEDDNKLTYIGRTLEDPDGRVLTYRIHYDGEFLYASYKMPVANAEIPPVFRVFKVDLEE